MGLQLMIDPPLTPPARPAFSNRFLRHVLLSLRMLAGSEYGAILHAVGLERWSRELPPPTPERTLPAAAATRLFQSVYQRLQPPLSLLFFTHMGEQMAQDAWEVPEIQALSQPLLGLSPAERVPLAWQRLTTLADRQVPTERCLRSDADNHYLLIEQCPLCRGIVGAERPICLVTARFYEVMFQKLIDRSVVVREVECAALGQPHCVFAVRRDRGH